MKAWREGDGIIGGIKGVAGEVANDYNNAKGFGAGAMSVGRNLQAMGSGIVEQVPNMILPMAGMLAGGAAGSAAGPVGTAVGGFAGAAAGNSMVGTSEAAFRQLEKAGINPTDTAAVKAYLDKNGDSILGETAVKGAVIGAVDTATMGLSHALLSGPGKAAANKALAELGVDVADKAAVSAASKSPAFKSIIANDAAYQASQTGAQKVARNAAAGLAEPAGEFAGEYVGSYAATGEADAKDAFLEAASSLGQSGLTFAGQKLYQRMTGPQAEAGSTSQPDAAPPAAPPGTPPGTPPVAPTTVVPPIGATPPPVIPPVAPTTAGAAQPAGPLRTSYVDASKDWVAGGKGRDVIRVGDQFQYAPEGSPEMAQWRERTKAKVAEGNPQTLIAQPAPPEPIKPSDELGLNPAAGPLSAAAVTAVDGDATPSMQAASQATTQQEQATQAQQQADDKRKSSGWTMNEFPVGDEPMVASFESKDKALFMTQATADDGTPTFNVRDAEWNVIATGTSFEEAAGRAKVQQASGGKAVQPTTGATDGATPTQAQQTGQKGQAESETDWSMGAKPVATPPGAGFQDSTAKRAQGLKAIRERNGLNKPVSLTDEGKTAPKSRDEYVAEVRRQLGDIKEGDALTNDAGDVWTVDVIFRDKNGDITAIIPKERGNGAEGASLDIDGIGGILMPSPYTDANGERKMSGPGTVTRMATAQDQGATAKTDTAEQPGTTGEGAGVSQQTPLTIDARKRNLATLKQRMMAGRKPGALANKGAKPQSDITYEQFKQQMQSHLSESAKYKPNEVGQSTFIQKMADLADKYPEYEARLDRESNGEQGQQDDTMDDPEMAAYENGLSARTRAQDVADQSANAGQPSLDDQLKSVNDELANQGRVQNARTRERRDQLRTAIAERDFPDVLKAVDGNVDAAEAINQALQFAGDEPRAKVVERALKNRGITDEYRKRWGERLAGSNPEQDVKAPADTGDRAGTVSIPPSVDALLTQAMEAQKGRITRLRNQAKADGTTLEERKAANLKVLAAEATLRKMRTTRFDAEDAVAAAMKSGNPEDARSIDDLFPKAFAEVESLLAKADTPPDQSKARAQSQVLEQPAQDRYPAPSIKQQRSNDWPSASDGWQMVGGSREAPGSASEKSAKIELGKNPEWAARGAVILPFAYNDGGVFGLSKYGETSTRYAILVREEKYTPPEKPEASNFDQKTLVDKSYLFEKPGDVGIVVGNGRVRFVSMSDAIAAVREALGSGTRPTPFQIHNATGIRLGDVDGVLNAMKAEAVAPVRKTVESEQATDLDAMFDDVLAEEVAKDEAKNAKPTNLKQAITQQRAKRAPRTATQAATSAAKNTASALGNAIDGLGALFGGNGKLGSGLSFDEQTYAKAKPLFQAAVANLGEAGRDMKEAMRAVVRMVMDKFGAQAAQNMKPYVVRFIEDTSQGDVPVKAETLTAALYQAIKANQIPKDNPALKKLVEAFDGKPADPARMKQAQEELETAIAMMARELVANNEGDRTTFDTLLRLYENQPNLNIRTSTSIANQAYSTPAPLAYLASRLAGITKSTVAHEPTAGTGMLLIGADPKKAIVNELNDLRIEALKSQGFAPTQKDAATQQLVPDGQQPDAIVTNPPFGSIKDADGSTVKVKVDGFSLGQIDHLIAARALNTMKQDGRATLILGANKVAGGLSTDDRIFFNWLYSHYNVVGHFEIEGDLYNRQGAGWPVRVITINGRVKSNKISPVAGTIQRVNNWDAVYEQFNQSLAASKDQVSVIAPTAGDGAGARPVGPVATPGQADKGGPNGSPRRDGDVPGAGTGVLSDSTEPAAGAVGDSADEQRLNAQSFVPATQPGQNPDGAERSEKPAGTDPVAEDQGNEFQLPYTPRSARKDEGVLIPANMAQPTQDALSRLEDEVGDIDEFARKELGYDTVADLHGALMGLQVDSVATSIYQIKQGKAVVIADQTGIGKGRQAASIIRWAALQGMTPVFVSVKPSLFTDMYGDLADIGTTDVTPFIMNSDAWVAGDGGSKLFANKSAGHKNVIQEIANSGQLPDGSNALFMTYSQINVANVQRQALMALAPNAVFILDESHNAAGASATGDFVIGALGAAKGVVYLSATYAKRPDNMPLYFKTDIGEAAADTDGLADAMASGGLPLQTVVSNNLVKAGQMFRRERSYDGVSIASVFDTPNRALHERMSDEATKALRAIVSADRMFHEVYVKSLAKRLALEGATVQDNAGNQIERGVQHTEFSSVVHNFVKQMLLGLKAQSAADEAIASLKRGEKPIIAVENTMGSFLNEYAAANGIGQGDSLGTFDYRTVLSRALARSRVIVEVAPNGDKVKRPVSMAELDEVTQASYRAAQAVIDGLTLSIPVSPIDWVRAEIARAGYKVAEITGRNLSVDYGDPKKPVLSAIDAAEQKDKVNTTRQFNSGNLDALILNVAGSTGISLHASEKFEDQRQRHMIVAQAAGDINIFMQMLGRVHRTGQVRLPKYTILSVDLPTEKRPTAVLSIKMKSLNANTSSNTESATSVKSSDILNKYGDQIVNQYLSDNYALARALGIEQEIGTDPSEDIARKATGRLALQPIEVQTGFYEEVESQYEALIDYLNKTNQNDLEPRTFDFDAKETRQEVLFDGPNKNTPFGEDAIYGEYSIKAQGEPMRPAEIKAVIAENLSGKTGQAHANALVDTLLQTYADQMNAGREKAGLVPGKFDEAKYTAFMKGLYGEEGAAWWVSNAKAAIAKGQDVAIMTKEQMANAQGSAAGIEFIRSHPIGKTFRVDINSEPFNAVVTGIRSTHKSTGNPFSLSKIQVTVAVNGALRSLSIPATQFRKIEVSSIAPGFQIEQLFREQPPNQRETAKIVTGNLLAAYGELQGVRGTIITFTKQDGTSEQGILLPKLFDYSKNTRGDYRLQDGAAALKFLQQSENKDIGRFGIMTRDGEVRVLPAGQGIRVQVPKSKLKGAKYFLDKGLIGVGGDFVTQGSFMVSVVYNPSDAVKMLDLLMKKQALYAMPSMAEEAKALTGGQDEKPAASRARPVFSRAAQGQASGVVQSIVDAITARWANAPKVVVAFDMSDPAIPERVRQEDQKQRSGGATGTPEGFYYKGTVYLMSSKLANPRDVVRVLLHESLGHFGLRGVFGKELKPILQQIATMRKSQIEAKMKEYGLRGVSNIDRLVAAEEVLAEMAQSSPQIGFVRRAVATIKAWLRKNIPGFMGMNMSDDEIITSFIMPARNYVVNGGPNGGSGGGVRFSRKTDIQAARKALEKIMRNGVTSPDDLQALLRVPGYSKWAKSAIAGDVAGAAALRRELQDAFPGSDWKAPKLIDQGIITIYPDWDGLTSQNLDKLTRIADKYDAPIGVRGGAATKQLVNRLDGFGFELYNGLQEREDRMPNVMFGMIRPAGGITATTPLFSQATQSPSTPVSTIRQAIAKAYGNLLNRLEGKGLVTLTQTEEEAIAAAAQARADKNGGDVEVIKQSLRASVLASQRAWHGTPHRGIEKFSTDKIGTGEGAQAFGWGLYFADRQELGEYYREKLSAGKTYTVKINGTYIDIKDTEGTENTALASLLPNKDGSRRSIDEVISSYKEKIGEYPKFAKNWTLVVEYLEKNKNAIEVLNEPVLVKGQLYEVDIPNDSDMLLWDKPLSEQTEAVRDAAMKAARKLYPRKDQYDDADLGRIKGEVLYQGLASYRFGGPKVASQYLASLGIKGIKYLDGTSRNAGEGSYNYVVFSGEDVQIVDVKYSKDGNLEGFFDPATGKSFLIADNLTAESAPATLMHEVGIHMAADGKFEPMFDRALTVLNDGSLESTEALRRMQESGETSGEEAAAYLVTVYETNRTNAPASVKQWMKDMIAAVRAWLFSKGVIVSAEQLTVADIAAVARANAKSMAVGDGRTGDGGRRFSRGTTTGMPENKAPGPQGDAQQGAAQGNAVAVSRQIAQAIQDDDDPYADYGLRVIPPEADVVVQPGDELPPSNQWDDGTDTGEALDGTSAVRIDSDTEDAALKAIRLIGAHGKPGPNGYYYGDQVVLIKGKKSGVGEDVGEILLNDAVVVATWRKPDKGNSEVAPNEQSTPDKREQTETPQFKRWFGDSKVVNADGKPLVVYHGTGADITEFSMDAAANERAAKVTGVPGFYFSPSPDVAGDYAFGKDGANVMPSYLALRNPKEVVYAELIGGTFDRASLEAQGHDGLTVNRGGKTWAFVAFNPTQIKSAIGNNGDFDGNNPDIRFSRTMGEALTSGVNNVKAFDVTGATSDQLAHYRGMGMQVLGRRQIVDLYGDMLPELKAYDSLVQKMDADKNESGAEADALVSDWAKLDERSALGFGAAKNPGMERKLADLMHDATLAQIDPDKPPQKGDDAVAHKSLEDKFNALSPKAQEVYRTARDMYANHFKKVQEALQERIQRSGMDETSKAKMIAKMDADLFNKLKGVYFPLARFGKYVVVSKNEAGETVSVSRAETLAEANKMRREVVKNSPQGVTVSRVYKDAEFNASRDAVGKGFVSDLMTMLQGQGVGEDVLDSVGQLYLSSLPDLSWAKHGIHRKGTPGFSQDARRAFAQNMFHGARHLAKLRYSDQLADKLMDMEERVKDQRDDEGFDQIKAQQVVDEMNARHELLMNPKTSSLSTALTSVGFVWFLGISPASALVNLSQTALVAYPVMAAKWGFQKAGTALLYASAEVARAGNDLGKVLKGEELAAFQKAVDDGTIDVTQAHDLAGVAQGEDERVAMAMRPVMRAASFMFHHAEKFNRQATFIAAYRLAKENGVDADKAFEQAKKATYDGHFDYSASNRARIMQGNWQKVLFLFKQYGQNMVYTLTRQAYLSMKGMTPEQRTEARKQLGGLLAMHAMAAGALGLPLVGVLLSAASMVGGDDDEPWDAEVALKNMMADAMGPKAAEVMAHGLSRLTPWDISSRVALNKLILPDIQEGIEGQPLWEKMVTAAAGPVAGIGGGFVKGMAEMGQGQYQRGLESMLPVALKNTVKAMRFGEEGAVDKTGVVIKDEVGAAGVIGQAMGFRPSDVALATEGKTAIYQADKALTERRSNLVRLYAMSRMNDDSEGTQDALDQVRQFNEKNPNRRITMPNLMQSVRNRQRRIDDAEQGVYLPKNRRDALEAGRFALAD